MIAIYSKRYGLAAFLWLVMGSCLFAQTLTQARSWFSEGKYAEALPVFQRYVKQSPSNTNYNYWYGVCCVETGLYAEAIPYLEKAAKRKLLDAYPYLLHAQTELYLFDDVVTNAEAYIELLASHKQSTEAGEHLLTRARMASLMLRGTEQICIIDSFVIDKDNFLSVYHIGRESGTVDTYDHFFETVGQQGIVYQNELGKKIYLSQWQDSVSAIYTSDKLLDEWSQPMPVEGLAQGNNAYPFLLTDGLTFYYANDGEESLGGYDIFVTRFNSETGRFLKPENVGMPYNSPANDYMMVIDEYNDLGWFASDRYQPQDSVCVYVFVPNDSRITYDYDMDNGNEETVRRAARIQSIRATWTDEEILRQARARLLVLSQEETADKPDGDFVFVVDDRTTYYALTDFQSSEARNLFRQWQQLKNDFLIFKQELDELRTQYASSTDEQRQQLTPRILDMETRYEQMRQEVDDLEIAARNTEKNHRSD